MKKSFLKALGLTSLFALFCLIVGVLWFYHPVALIIFGFVVVVAMLTYLFEDMRKDEQ